MKKVLGIAGSPRKGGNTHILVSQILKGAREAGARTELVSLSNLRIKECDGCHTCWETEVCRINDGMKKIYKKLMDSDCIILATPMYWFGPTVAMKALIDRLVYFCSAKNEDKIKGKEVVLALAFAGDDSRDAAPLLKMLTMTTDYLGMKLKGKILAPGVGEKGAIRKKKRKLKEAFNLGRSIGK
ncbi:MAG: flavodoxin family protein [Elusimicrobiota bacterium]|nr:flavodoxin family protein [Elusimicrobiota bacterium]MDH5661812.1 flavodoxin family protein [Elusimicrobiota bacterium]